MLDLADFALQEQPEHSLMVAISRAWYNGSYTMAANPIKSLEMHYTMIQFLINLIYTCQILFCLMHVNNNQQKYLQLGSGDRCLKYENPRIHK